MTTAHDPDTQSSFADLLRRARRKAGLTQEELAERAGLSTRAITAIERGISRAPHKTTVELLCAALELPPEQCAAFLASARKRVGDDDAGLDATLAPDDDNDDNDDDDAAGADELPATTLRAVGGFLGALPDRPIVTREAELRQIGDALDATLRGSAKIVFLAGEPGVGKTRLAQEASLAAQERGYLVVTGRCHEPYQTMPYYPFVEALLAAVTNAAPAIREELPRSWPEVQRLLPGSVQDREASGVYRRAEEQQRLFWSVTRFFQALALEQPIALLLDDLHWADDASLGLLQHLAQHTRASRVFMLCAYRDTELSRRHPLRRIIHDLSRERLAERLAVTRLSRNGTAALVADIIAGNSGVDTNANTNGNAAAAEAPAALIEAIHRSTDGNPFFTVEVLRALQQRGEMRSADGHWEWRSEQEILVPESVQAAIDERLARLEPGAQELLEEASILGESFTFDDLVALQERDEDEVEAALEAAIAASLAQEIGPDSYRFNHVLTQQALYHGVSRRRRRRLHLAAGAALERLPQSQRSSHASELAWHFLQAEEPARALPYVVQAGDLAQAIYAYAAAENRYRTAVELATDLQDTAQEAVAQARRGTALAALARWDEALAALQRAAELDRAAGANEALAQDVALMGRVYNDHGTPETGIEVTRPYLDQLPPETSPGALAQVYTTLSHLYLASGSYHELPATAERAVELASEAGDPRLLVEAKGRHGVALAILGHYDEALPMLHEVVRLAEEVGALETQVLALNNIAHCHLLIGPLLTARDIFTQAIELAPRLHSPIMLPLLLVNHGFASFLLGDWQRAHADLNSADQSAQELGVNALSAALPVTRGRLYMAEGRPGDAARVIAEGLAFGEPDAQTFCDAQSVLAERELLSGRPAEARDRLAPVVEKPGRDDPDIVALLPLLAWAYLELGDSERAATISAEATRRMRAMGMRVALPNALRIQAMVAQRQGNRVAAETALAEAVTIAEAMGCPYAKAQALFAWARLAPDDGASQERLREAFTIFTRLGASGDAARAERALKERN